ncbi:MAG TPA: hypothetical protein VGN82_17220 [Bosea sp. (in: a-proteobacteria)]|jgi:hypothetical protein|uniref:hypothetical protein n=1 Tax=Bosea sp. (in: a-proteobacteria) TaxID=1871050 RepID=UPI002E0DDEF1|nr:hypothetical protein [Bosea sp. (in: a-proteobacteria)]
MVAFQWMVGGLVGAGIVSGLPIGAFAAEPEQGWSLWVSQRSRPGLLTACSMPRGLAWPQSADQATSHVPQRLDGALTIRWQGGLLAQAVAPAVPAPPQARTWNPFDSCFVLSVRGVVVAAGGVVPRASARLLRSDTLVIQDDRPGRPLAFTLLPAFPAEVEQPVPPEWRAALTPLSRPMADQPR